VQNEPSIRKLLSYKTPTCKEEIDEGYKSNSYTPRSDSCTPESNPFSLKVFSALLKATCILLNVFPLLSRVRAFVLPLLEVGYLLLKAISTPLRVTPLPLRAIPLLLRV
jgi:hypothetical protein